MDILGILSLIGGIFGIVGLLAASALYFRGTYAAAKIAALESDLQLERERTAGFRTEVSELRSRLETLSAKFEALDQENKTLREAPKLAVETIIAVLHEDAAMNKQEMRVMTESIQGSIRELEHSMTGLVHAIRAGRPV